MMMSRDEGRVNTEPMSSEERAAVEQALLAIGLREAALEIAEQARRATGDAESHRACDFARGELDRVKIKSLPTLRDAARRYLALTAALDGWEPRCMWDKCEQVGAALASGPANDKEVPGG